MRATGYFIPFVLTFHICSSYNSPQSAIISAAVAAAASKEHSTNNLSKVAVPISDSAISRANNGSLKKPKIKVASPLSHVNPNRELLAHLVLVGTSVITSNTSAVIVILICIVCVALLIMWALTTIPKYGKSMQEVDGDNTSEVFSEESPLIDDRPLINPPPPLTPISNAIENVVCPAMVVPEAHELLLHLKNFAVSVSKSK
eukprot:GHVL01008822.1.p1 GENE.GHVL01008822.1~~GHVL01008822.1.p1  ORF type:complete len:202 (+),score=32.12 GHVL01008822.1:115-720(+)